MPPKFAICFFYLIFFKAFPRDSTFAVKMICIGGRGGGGAPSLFRSIKRLSMSQLECISTCPPSCNLLHLWSSSSFIRLSYSAHKLFYSAANQSEQEVWTCHKLWSVGKLFTRLPNTIEFWWQNSPRHKKHLQQTPSHTTQHEYLRIT